MVRATLVILVLMLLGCAKPEAFISGVVVEPPLGWVNYCYRNPNDNDCKL